MEAHRTAKRAKLPVKDTNDAVFRWVEDEVVELVVTVDDSQPSLPLVRQVRPVPCDHLAEARDLTRRFPGIYVDGLRLRLRDRGQRLDLPREVRAV